MKDFWNERYAMEEYVYGEEPNVFFAEQLSKLKAGKLILPCEGEGRNAVYAAKLGWQVNAFDMSESALKKAQQLANKKGVNIDYQVTSFEESDYAKESADAVAFIYAHFPAGIRKAAHQKAIEWLKPGGKLIIEAFRPEQLSFSSGGPKELSMLYTEDMLRGDLEGMQIISMENLEVELQEGNFHKGKAAIIRVLAEKI